MSTYSRGGLITGGPADNIPVTLTVGEKLFKPDGSVYEWTAVAGGYQMVKISTPESEAANRESVRAMLAQMNREAQT